jgi:hypothetical protein
MQKNTTQSIIKPILGSILHTYNSRTRANSRWVSPRSNNSIHSLQPHTRIPGLRNQLQPIDRARFRWSHIRRARGLDIAILLRENNLALRAQEIENRCAVGCEVMVSYCRGGCDGCGQGGKRHVDGDRREAVEHGFVGGGQRHAVEEGCYGAEGYWCGGCVDAGVVLYAAAESDVLKGLIGGWGGGEFSCVWGDGQLV